MFSLRSLIRRHFWIGVLEYPSVCSDDHMSYDHMTICSICSHYMPICSGSKLYMLLTHLLMGQGHMPYAHIVACPYEYIVLGKKAAARFVLNSCKFPFNAFMPYIFYYTILYYTILYYTILYLWVLYHMLGCTHKYYLSGVI